MSGRLGAGVPAGNACRVPLQGVETITGKAFGCVLALGDFHLSAFAFFHRHLNGGDHGLTCILVCARLAVIEHVPLPVDFADGTVGVAVWSCRSNDIALLILVTCTAVDDGASVCPGTEWIVRGGVGQCLCSAFFAYPWESQVIDAVTLEGEWAFFETFRKTFHHFRLTVEFGHVIFQFAATDTHAAPVDITLTIIVN